MPVHELPTLNAALNSICTLLLLIGYAHIRAGRITQHRRTMLTAFGTSVLFLISYVIYHLQVGSVPYPGTGWLRVVYFSILIPHIILAAVVVPLAILTLKRGLIRDDRRHKQIARITFPIWLFVSVTGVVIYAMLYF
ncbi:MAG: DUF420 domain-containing protein [Acidimicrobiia bacterium]|nr:DUF420 domain-containing protein [Acidimicrobiia bacterium]